MARVKDSYYFETFVECADYSLQAAKLLKEIMTDYDSTMIGENTKKIHFIEHQGDQVKHNLTKVLARAFITPFDREDIAELSQKIDTMTDYDSTMIGENTKKIHFIEHQGDQVKHNLTKVLARAFITPFDREDIAELSQKIDTMTDSIESVGMRLYTNNIKKIRPDALPVISLLINAVEDVKTLLKVIKLNIILLKY